LQGKGRKKGDSDLPGQAIRTEKRVDKTWGGSGEKEYNKEKITKTWSDVWGKRGG